MKHPLKYLAFFLLLFPLAGCLGEPSGEDLRAAVERSLDQDAASLTEAGKVFGEAGKTLTDMLGKKELHGVRKIGCVSARNAPGYICDVELDMTMPAFTNSTFICKIQNRLSDILFLLYKMRLFHIIHSP